MVDTGRARASTPATAGVDGGQARRLRMAAALLVVAAAVGGPAQMLHPLPDPADPDSFAPLVAESDAWITIHLLALLAYALVTGGLVLLLGVLAEKGAAVPARLGGVAAVVGLSAAVVWTTSDGIATKRVVDLWAEAPPADAAVLFHVARGLEELNLALFFMSLVTIFGLPVLLTCVALWRSRLFPRWLAGLGALIAASAICIGIVQVYTGRSLLWTHVLTPIAAAGVSVWGVLAAVLMWRLAARAGSAFG